MSIFKLHVPLTHSNPNNLLNNPNSPDSPDIPGNLSNTPLGDSLRSRIYADLYHKVSLSLSLSLALALALIISLSILSLYLYFINQFSRITGLNTCILCSCIVDLWKFHVDKVVYIC